VRAVGGLENRVAGVASRLSFPLDRVRGLPAKVYSTFALTDEAYAVTALSPQQWPSRAMLLAQFVFQVAWVSGASQMLVWAFPGYVVILLGMLGIRRGAHG
jgi:predicted branched-subunit amino acid permease